MSRRFTTETRKVLHITCDNENCRCDSTYSTSDTEFYNNPEQTLEERAMKVGWLITAAGTFCKLCGIKGNRKRMK